MFATGSNWKNWRHERGQVFTHREYRLTAHKKIKNALALGLVASIARPVQALAYVYFEEEPGRGSAAHPLTRDEARRIAANIVKVVSLTLPKI